MSQEGEEKMKVGWESEKRISTSSSEKDRAMGQQIVPRQLHHLQQRAPVGVDEGKLGVNALLASSFACRHTFPSCAAFLPSSAHPSCRVLRYIPS